MWYFAYGSNMEKATLAGRRGVRVSASHAARAAGWRLVLDKPPLVPIGESFANIVPDPAAQVLGVLYEVTPADLEHIELTEGVRIGNYRRIDIPVVSLVAPATGIMAATLVSDARDPTLRPSVRYMACLIAGAEEHGLPAEWIAFLRGVPAQPESREAAEFRPLVDAVLRRSDGG
jgi:gamma-glutamylcyclotransferase